MIKVHIIDDHKVLVEGLINLFDRSGVTTITGVSHTLSDCRSALVFETPDVLLLDINLTDGNGIDFCEEVRRKYPEMKVLVLSMHDEYSVVKRALKAGASGYILKHLSITAVVEGIETIMDGDIFLCDEIDRMMKKRTEEHTWVAPGELKVLRLLAEGFDSKTIAKKINRTVNTVDSTRKRLLFKFDAKNVAELIKKATNDKWI